MVPSRLLITALSLYFGTEQLRDALVRWANTGNSFWQVNKDRPHPAILDDPRWGNHAYIQLNAVKLHIVEKGDRSKPLMLFIHGFPEFWFIWRKAMEHFAKDYWVVAPDMRGYGDSEKPSSISAYRSTHLEEDVLQLVKALGRTKFILVGRDWGAVLSWQIAAKHPDQVEKLIIVNGAHPSVWRKGIWGNRVQLFKAYYIFAFQIPMLPEYIVYTGDNWRFDDLVGFLPKAEVECYKYAYRTRERWTTAINYYRNLFGPGPDGFLREDLNLPKIKAKTLVIWGQDDEFVDRTLAPMNADYVEDMTYVPLYGTGHYCNEDVPEKVHTAMENFLNKTSRRAG